MERRKAAEMDNLDQRMRALFAQKDATIASLHEQCQAAQLKATHIEALLDRQRQDLMRGV